MARAKARSSSSSRKSQKPKRIAVTLRFRGVESKKKSKIVGLVRALARSVNGQEGRLSHKGGLVTWVWYFANTAQGKMHRAHFVQCARDNKFGHKCSVTIHESSLVGRTSTVKRSSSYKKVVKRRRRRSSSSSSSSSSAGPKRAKAKVTAHVRAAVRRPARSVPRSKFFTFTTR